MRKLFERIVDFMEENGSIQSEYRDIYLFALQTVAVYAFNIGTGVVIGAAFGELLYCMIFLIAFMLLRQEAGGYHAPGWMSCYFLSCGILVLTLLWIKAEFAYQTCLTIAAALAAGMGMYAKDFSVKAKASLAQRRKEGSYVGGPAPYGYKAVWEGKVRRLIPDENTEEIVRYIFQRFIETESYTAVADDLNTRKINPPAVYHKTGEVYCPPDAAYKGWDKSGVERIIKSDTYAGKLVQGKTSITARDENNRIHKPEDDWAVKEEAHEPLITPEIGKEAAGVRRKLREQTKSHAHPTEGCPIGENIFDKVLYCGVCGRKMTRHSYVKHYADGSRMRIDGYFCLNGGATKTDSCPSSNRIPQNVLTDILFSLLEKEFDTSLKKKRIYLDKAGEIIWQKKQELERSLRSVTYAKERLAEEESDKYMAYRMGNLSQKDYVEYKMCKENRLRDLEKQESSFKEQEVSLERDGETYLKAVRALIKLKNEQVLTRELIETLIDKIYVFPGKRVEVLFTYSDALVERQVKK